MTSNRELQLPGDRVSGYLRWTIALLCLGAAEIHFAVVPEHFEEVWTRGAFFFVVANLQLLLSGLIVWRPSRRILIVTALANAAVAATWMISRAATTSIFGIPAEPLGFADTLSSGLEVAAAAGCLLLLFSRTLATRPVARRLAVPTVAFLGAIVLTLSGLSLTPLVGSS